ncbi:MAG: BatA and WFA domain-containing protein [Gemmatimonadota bacterium]
MSLLNPWFLLAAASVAVPVFLHLFHRRKTRRLSFPALRYLERTEREHAREIRLRQLLLLLARVSALILIVAAGARLVIHGSNASHPPTAVAIVLDNSMSSGLVLGDERVLDVLKRVAERALDATTPEDRFWVVRAGTPWVPAVPGNAAEARATLRATEPSGARGDLSEALRRAGELLATSDFGTREIHLVSDLQRTAFEDPGSAPAGSIPVVVWSSDDIPDENRGIVQVSVGGGLPPVQGQSTEVGVRLANGSEEAGSSNVRMIVGERIRAAATVPPGSATTLTLPPSAPGWVVGSVETDPDALSLDDRRYFAFRSRPAPRVVTAGEAGRFLREALAVLEDANRVRRAGDDTAADPEALVIAAEGISLESLEREAHALVVPPADATLLPALNGRLQAAGVPWSYGVRTGGGGAGMTGFSLPAGLDGARVDAWYALRPSGAGADESSVLAEVAGDPWAVETRGAGGARVLLLASPLDATSSSLPLSAGLVRFLDWAASEWAGSSGSGSERYAGTRLDAPSSATHVRTPGDSVFEIDGTRSFAATGSVGHYTFLAGDSVVSVVAVNPPPEESDLTRLDERELAAAIGSDVTVVTEADSWSRAVFRERRGPEVWWPLLFALALLLVAESLLAAAGKPDKTPAPVPQPETVSHGAS